MEETANQPEKLGYGPLASVVVTISTYFASQILGFFIFIFLYSVYVTTKTGWVNTSFFWHLVKENVNAVATLTTQPWLTFFQILIIEAITLGFVLRFLHIRKTQLSKIGLNHPKLKHIVYALAGFAAYFVIYIVGILIAKRLFPSLNVDQKQELGFSTATQGSALWWIFFSLVVLPPVVEEIVVRGFLFTGLRSKLNFIRAAVFTSILFAAAHLGEGGSGGLLWIAALDTFILSMVLCYIREKTASLWPGIGIHMIKNGLAFVILFNIIHIL